jgi:hypothetical protein
MSAGAARHLGLFGCLEFQCAVVLVQLHCLLQLVLLHVLVRDCDAKSHAPQSSLSVVVVEKVGLVRREPRGDLCERERE